MDLPDLLLVTLLGAYPVGVAAALGVRGALGRGLVAGGGLAGSLATAGLGAVGLVTGIVPTGSAAFLPLTGVALRVDGLSAFFLVVIGVVGAAVTVYGFG
jgi:formate hydrogenlyase subunit 3/multisubunit Na+/H+ antiporter MnhD subunit